MPTSNKVTKQTAVQAGLDRSPAPPDSPNARLFEFAEKVIDTVKLIQISATKDDSTDGMTQAETADRPAKTIVKASKLEVKEVHQLWDAKSYAYKIVESIPTVEWNDLDAYVFIVRADASADRISFKTTVHIDVKSIYVQDSLRTIFKDIQWINMNGDRPSVEQSLLFHYLPELETLRANATADADCDREGLVALDLMIDVVKKNNESVTERLAPLLEAGKVTYDLLWALFKANSHVISTCTGSGKIRCLKYEMCDEKKTSQGVEYLELQCQYLDYDGSLLGEVKEKLTIEKFSGARRIDTLNVYPVQWHPSAEAIETSLVVRGQRFVELIGLHHQQYNGHAFFQRRDGIIRLPVSSRIVVDAQQFRKANPSYPRLFKQKAESFIDSLYELESRRNSDREVSERVKSKGLSPSELTRVELLICAPTVLAYSLDDKFWGEYALDDLNPIQWSTSPMACLCIPKTKKEIIMAAAHRDLGRLQQRGRDGASRYSFDDVVEGKGRGISILLYGPPGVGKTLTAEALAEHFRRPTLLCLDRRTEF